VLRARRRLLVALGGADLVVCHSAWSHALFAPVVRRAGLRLITFLHNESQGRHWLERWAARTPPDHVVCNSLFTQEGVQLAFPGARSSVWYPAVPEQSDHEPDVRRHVRLERGLAEDTRLIVQSGRFEPLKGHERHLRALARLRDVPGWHCLQAGEPQSRAERAYAGRLRRLAAELGIAERISFIGFRDDLPRILAAADLYCQPNTRPEAFGLSIAEALAAGLPVVASALGAAQELVGDSGLLVRDDDGLVQALRQLLTSPERRRELASGAPARWRRLCDPTRQLPALDALLADVAGH
jgi:glycosyltransferase involved in cell wall biosynthesis